MFNRLLHKFQRLCLFSINKLNSHLFPRVTLSLTVLFFVVRILFFLSSCSRELTIKAGSAYEIANAPFKLVTRFVENIPSREYVPDILQNVSFFVPFSLYPPVYPPMALALFFDRVFENPFRRQRLPARRSMSHTSTRNISLYTRHTRMHDLVRVCQGARVRAHILEYEKL